MRKIIFLLIIGNLCLTVLAQSDKSLSANNVPAYIPAYIDHTYPSHSNIAYYREKSDADRSYEATFKYNKQRYTLLFDTLGNCLETEIEIPFEKLPETIEEAIEQTLKTDFQKYSIKKTEQIIFPNKIMYEVEVQGKKEHDTEYYEYYFDDKGAFTHFEKIKLKPIPSFF
jgi:hypothetical protein